MPLSKKKRESFVAGASSKAKKPKESGGQRPPRTPATISLRRAPTLGHRFAWKGPHKSSCRHSAECSCQHSNTACEMFKASAAQNRATGRCAPANKIQSNHRMAGHLDYILRLGFGNRHLLRHRHGMLISQMPVHLHGQSATVFVPQPTCKGDQNLTFCAIAWLCSLRRCP